MPENLTKERSRVQLCGRLSIELDGRELAGDLRGRQVPLLFAFLALNRERAISRDELAEALWPDRAPRSQDGALRVLLSRLRSGLGADGADAVRGRDEVTLELPEPVWIDVEAATAGVPRAREALQRGDARAAWALAQVPLNIAGRGLLPGAQAAWIEAPRRELAETRLEALEIIGRAGLGLGPTQLGSVQRAGRTLIELEAYRESGYVLLMQALAAQGNVAEGLRVYDRLRSLLREELGTTPSAEAIAAYERLLSPQGPAARVREPDRASDEDAGIALPAAIESRAAGPLVGRRAELAELRQWWQGDDASARQRVVLLAGDAGAGKSRLLAELAAGVHDSGAVVLAGHAPEETLVPYQPFLEAIGHFAFHAPQPRLREAALGSGAELARLMPELRRRLPELRDAEPTDPETDRYRLFEATADLLGAIAAPEPLLVVLDDLHWADRPTLLMLRHLVRSPQAGRLRIAAAHRTGEQPSDGFAQMVADLRREGLLHQLDVAGLPPGDAAELVRASAGAAPSSAYTSALYEETEGNPLFIVELVRHLEDSGVDAGHAGVAEVRGAGVPDDVRDLIARRLARLSADGLECLRVAAVIGREVDGALLEEVLGADEDAFLAALEEGLDSGLIRDAPDEPGRFAFAHALIRETLYGQMSSARRARIHQRVGRALEQRGAGAPVGALAHHFTHAPEPADAERAITYAIAAGEQASAMLAHEEAVAHYGRALELLTRVDPDADGRRCAVLIELGEARLRGGERATAWPAFREAAAIASRRGDAPALIRAALGASRRFIQPPGLVDAELIAMLEQALAAIGPERTVTRVRLLARLCACLYFSDRRDEMRRLSAEATAVAAELADPEAAALAAGARRRAYWTPEHLERRLADSTMLLRAAREAGDLQLAMQGHAWLLVDLLEAGDRTAVEAQIGAFAAGAEQLRQPMFQWSALVWQAMLALLEGRLEEAEVLAADARAHGIRPEPVAAAQYHLAHLMAIRREQLRAAELAAGAERLAAGQSERPTWQACLALLACDVGRREEAAARLDALAGPDAPEIPRDGDWLTVMAMLAEVAVELGDGDRCAVLYERMVALGESVIVVGVGAVCWGSVARHLGRLALGAGERDRAIAHLRRAVAVNESLGATVQLAHAQIDLARALGDSEEARELLGDADRTARRLTLALVARRVGEALSPVG